MPVLSPPMSGFLALVGLFAMGVGAWGLIKGQVGWARIVSRRVAGAVVAAGFVLALVAGALDPPKPTTEAVDGTVATATTNATTAVPATSGPSIPAGDDVRVGSITDGDTLRTSDGMRIRLIGMDTPEVGAYYAIEATAHLAELVPVGSAIRLVYDVERLDRYGRTLAYVYRLPDGLFVNLA